MPPLEVTSSLEGLGSSRDQATMPPLEVSVDYIISGFQATMPPLEVSVDYVISGGFGFSRDQDTMPPLEVSVEVRCMILSQL